MQRIPVSRYGRARFLLGVALLLAAGALLLGTGRAVFAEHPAAWIWLGASLLLVSLRDFIEIDTARGRVARRTGLVYAFAWKAFPMTGIKCVVLDSFVQRTTSKSGSSRSTTYYSVGVEGARKGELCHGRDLWTARFVAERVCRALGTRMENRLFGAPSRRDADELDMQLAERWRLEGRFKEAPRLDAATQLTVEHRDDASELTLPVAPFPRTATAIAAAAFIAVFSWVYWGGGIPLSVWIGVVALIAGISGTAIAMHSGRSRLRFTPTAVEFRTGRFPFARRIALAEIEELLVSNEEFVLMSDRHFIRIARPDLTADREAQRQFIDRQIARRALAD